MGLAAGRTILVVNDYPGEREAIARHLALEGYRVVTATDYRTAVKVLADRVPSLVCVDLMLPNESGYELVEHMRNQRRLQWVPILVIGERGSPDEMAYAEDLGANAYLKKPFTRERLIKYVTVLLDGPNASRPSVRRLRRSEPPPSSVPPSSSL